MKLAPWHCTEGPSSACTECQGWKQGRQAARAPQGLASQQSTQPASLAAGAHSGLFWAADSWGLIFLQIHGDFEKIISLWPDCLQPEGRPSGSLFCPSASSERVPGVLLGPRGCEGGQSPVQRGHVGSPPWWPWAGTSSVGLENLCPYPLSAQTSRNEDRRTILNLTAAEFTVSLLVMIVPM